ncbi:MAG: hypothetical protein RLY67_89 [Pseudomonadota bacterium]
MRELSNDIDQIVVSLWAQAAVPGASLIAVGGYGRGELAPYSDIDLLILTDGKTTDEELSGPVANFVSSLWDAGLDAGHSLRSIDECVEQARADLTVATALLESRALADPTRLHPALVNAWRTQIPVATFVQGKLLEMRQRHSRFNDTPYSLEPNVKESPGGLRDLQVLNWISAALGLGRGWSELVTEGLLTAYESTQLQQQEAILLTIRAHLHISAGRREDRLVYDLQTLVAESLECQPVRGKRLSEVLMQRYYRAAKLVRQVTTVLLANLEPRLQQFAGNASGSGSGRPEAGVEAMPSRPLAPDFYETRGLLDITDETLFERRPEAILEAFILMARECPRLGMTARALRSLWHARELVDRPFRESPENRAAFLSLLREPRGVLHALRIMNDLGILGRLLPVFRRIVGQMQHDLFHVYTVDQHILQVIRNLRRFSLPEHAHEFPRLTSLMQEFGEPWKLYLAALFHDIAKGRGGDHSELGEAEVKRFCRQFKIDAPTTDLLMFLVRHHLTMSSMAQKEDLADPLVIQRFAAIVQTQQRLRALYLLTVADIRGTSPKVWNNWKAKLLEDLFDRTEQLINSQGSDIDAKTLHTNAVSHKRELALQQLKLEAKDIDAVIAFWRGLGLQYFLSHDALEIAWHARNLVGRESETLPRVFARIPQDDLGIQLVVYQKDSEDLFARITEFLDRQGLPVLEARIHTTPNGFVLDSFLLDPAQFEGQERELLTIVSAGLREHLISSRPLGECSQGRLSRRSKSFPIHPSVQLVMDEPAQNLILSVTAADRPGLLYRIARCLSTERISLRSARINTLGERAEDHFLLEPRGLETERQRVALETALLNVLQDAGAAKPENQALPARAALRG